MQKNWRQIAVGLRIQKEKIAEIGSKVSDITTERCEMDHDALYLILYHWTNGLRTTPALIKLVETLKRLGYEDGEGNVNNFYNEL